MYGCVEVVHVAVLACVIGLTRGSQDDGLLRFYKRNFQDYIEVPLSSGRDVINSDWYDYDKNTVFFAHGFTGTPQGPAVTAVISAYLATQKHNVVLLNWETMAAQRDPSMATSYLTWASPNARKLGAKFADALVSMLEVGLRVNGTHLVGHSLGAQLFGITGSQLASRGIMIPWITGLDPASVGYEGAPLGANLNKKSAEFVDIIHSDPSKYGYRRSHGTVDYWPNFTMRGPVWQPGCKQAAFSMFTPQDLCNHNRSWQLLIDAIQQPHLLIGSYAKNYRAWKNSDNTQRRRKTLTIGELPEYAVSGDFFLTTNEQSPYGRGYDGI